MERSLSTQGGGVDPGAEDAVIIDEDDPLEFREEGHEDVDLEPVGCKVVATRHCFRGGVGAGCDRGYPFFYPFIWNLKNE